MFENGKGRKGFWSAQPNDPNSSLNSKTCGELNVTRLAQTSIQDCKHIKPSLGHIHSPFDTSARDIINNAHQCIGRLEQKDGAWLGTAILISVNCALVARHSIENIPLIHLRVRFNYSHSNRSFPPFPIISTISSIIEDDVDFDYAIICLKDIHFSGAPIPLPYANLTRDAEISRELILLHHPLGKILQASIHGIDKQANATNYLMTLHDTDFGSSGGAYFNASGDFFALHLGCQVEDTDFISFNLWRYAIPINTIAKTKPGSFIAKLCDKEISPKECAVGINAQGIAKAKYPVNFIEVEMRPIRKKKIAKQRNDKKVMQAIGRTDIRLARYPTSSYQKKNVRELAGYFDQLGLSALAHKNLRHTTTNKTTFTNSNTGWSIVHDNHGKYNTVINELGHYVALDGTTSANGQNDKFHFRN